MLGADGRDGAGPHLGDGGGVEDGAGRPGARIEQVEDGEFRRQILAVIVDEISDNLHPGQVHGGDVAAQHVEVAVEGGVGHEVDARLDGGLLAALGQQARFDCVDDLVVGQGELVDVERVQIVDVDGLHGRSDQLRRPPHRRVRG